MVNRRSGDGRMFPDRPAGRLSTQPAAGRAVPLLGTGMPALRSADAGAATATLLSLQRRVGNEAVRRLVTGTPVQRDDAPVDAVPQGTVVADKPAGIRIDWSKLGSLGVKPLKLKEWAEREYTPEGATITAGVELDEFWSGKLSALPGVLSNLRLVPKLGAGVEVETFDWGTGAVRPKVGVKLFELSLQKLFKGLDVVGEISATTKAATAGAGVEWSKLLKSGSVSVGLKGELEGELRREDPMQHKGAWEFEPKGKLELKWTF